jgi:hypothetical protein
VGGGSDFFIFYFLYITKDIIVIFLTGRGHCIPNGNGISVGYINHIKRLRRYYNLFDN